MYSLKYRPGSVSFWPFAPSNYNSKAKFLQQLENPALFSDVVFPKFGREVYFSLAKTPKREGQLWIFP